MSSPKMRMRPAVGSSRPSSIDSVVVLPAPLPPSSAAVTPAGTAKSMPSTASVAPKRLVSAETSMTERDTRRIMAESTLMAKRRT